MSAVMNNKLYKINFYLKQATYKLFLNFLLKQNHFIITLNKLIKEF